MHRVIWKRVVLGSAMVLTCTWLVLSQRGAGADPGDAPPPAPDTGEPITGTPSWPEPGDESETIDPFVQAQGQPGAVPIENLTVEEQAVVEAGADTTGWATTHDGFAAATRQAGERAEAEAAANALGLEGLGGVGVVP